MSKMLPYQTKTVIQFSRVGSMFGAVWNQAEKFLQTKHNGHLTFHHVNDCLGMLSDSGMPGAILSCKVVDTRGFSSHNCITTNQ